MRRICVFAGSGVGADPAFAADATRLGHAIASRGWGLVYGGASIGLMGKLADAALAEGGEVIGVTPRLVFRNEKPHEGLTKLHIVRSMHRRKALMTTLADAFIALPGGFGTFDELFEILTWAQLGIHTKPIGILNIAAYFDPFMLLVKHAVKSGFLSTEHAALLTCDKDAERLLDVLHALSTSHAYPRGGILSSNIGQHKVSYNGD